MDHLRSSVVVAGAWILFHALALVAVPLVAIRLIGGPSTDPPDDPEDARFI